MNSINRFGLAVAGVAATLTLGGALVVDGYTSARNTVSQPGVTNGATALDPQTVYVRPAQTPATVTVTQTAPGQQATPPVIHVVVPAPGGGDDGAGDD